MSMTGAEKQAAYRQRQRERMAIDPAYAAEVKAKRAAQDKAYKQENREKYNARMREWHRKTVENSPEYLARKRAAGRKHYAENQNKRREANKRWYANADRSEYNLAWSRANRDKRAEVGRRREARKKGATQIDKFTRQDVWIQGWGVCGICMAPANPDDWHVDHIIPLSRGGQHTLNNVQVSHPRCNLSKYNKLLTEVA